MKITIRSVKRTDGSDISRILDQLGWFNQDENVNENSCQTRIAGALDLFLSSPDHEAFVAELGHGKLIGYMTVHWSPYFFLDGIEGLISELFIDENHRGKGIGSQLINHVKKLANYRDCSRLMLINSRSRDSYQRQFYEKQGFRERPEVANFVYEFH
ncbi:MAG: GNAT family N-acetyltransferase [Gammaproteobacteria bacterium]|nr:GNAT family N-acetyltransferase [Gammaproteobacteria bacterium]MDH5731912.1 GNAT family N-acetyltransferase [Gammaproteobacteria bacterium]